MILYYTDTMRLRGKPDGKNIQEDDGASEPEAEI